MSKFKLLEGREGEKIAAEFLKKKGYRIIEMNFRIKNGEADIVAIDEKENALVIVEVKTRISEEFGTPFEAITSWKLRALVNVAQYYKLIHPKLPDLLRIDAISVVLSSNNEPLEVVHLENISGF